MVVIIEMIQLEEFPKLKEFATLLHSAWMLNTSSKTILVRECMSRSDKLIVHTANSDLISIANSTTVLEQSKIGLEVHQWQRVYKRSLASDVSKLLK